VRTIRSGTKGRPASAWAKAPRQVVHSASATAAHSPHLAHGADSARSSPPRRQRQHLQRVQREEVRHAQVAVHHAPADDRQPRATVGSAHRVLQPPAHEEARHRRQQQQPQPKPPCPRGQRRERAAATVRQRPQRGQQRDADHHDGRHHDGQHHGGPDGLVQRTRGVEVRARASQALPHDRHDLQEHRDRQRPRQRAVHGRRRRQARDQHPHRAQEQRDRDGELERLQRRVGAGDQRRVHAQRQQAQQRQDHVRRRGPQQRSRHPLHEREQRGHSGTTAAAPVASRAAGLLGARRSADQSGDLVL
jgi:hypothetical protein